MQTLQEQYNQIKQGKGNKPHFLKQARHLFPDYINQYNNYEDTINILKSKSILSENKANLGMVSGSGRKDWFSLFQENVKAEEKKVSQQVLDKQAHAYDNKDVKNIDNVYGNSFLNGFYTEMQDPKNKLKTPDQLKQIVAKNLGKDWNYYATNAQFGIKGIGYTDEAPGLGKPKDPKGKWKASGYGDLDFETEKVKANTKDTLGAGEAKTTMPKKVAEMPVAPQSSKGVGKMKTPGKPKTIKMQEGIFDRDILSRPLSNPDIKYNERSPEELGKEMDGRSENHLLMKYSKQINDPNITDDVLRYMLSGKGVPAFGGRPNAIDKIIKDRNIRESQMDMLGGETPYGKYEMIKNIVEPNLGSNYKAYIMFDGPKGEYDMMKTKYASNTNDWKNLYRSSNYQGYADISPDGNVIKATILDKGGIVGAVYVKDSVQESKLRNVIQQIIKEELNMKEIDSVGKMAEYEAKTKKISEEILKRKKKLKALTTLEEIEKGSTNKDMLKSLKKEIKTLEGLKMKLDKKFTPKEEVIGEEETAPTPLKEGYDKDMPLGDYLKGITTKNKAALEAAKKEAQRISKEEGVIQHVEVTPDLGYRVSDWYDDDYTIISYNNGNEYKY